MKHNSQHVNGSIKSVSVQKFTKKKMNQINARIQHEQKQNQQNSLQTQTQQLAYTVCA